MEDYDNCICAEWDGEGWSVCGMPCPQHITQAKIDEAIKETEDYLESNPRPAEPIYKSLHKIINDRLVMLRNYHAPDAKRRREGDE